MLCLIGVSEVGTSSKPHKSPVFRFAWKSEFFAAENERQLQFRNRRTINIGAFHAAS